MAVSKCSNCKGYYWRFRPDHPPARFCSVICSETKRDHKRPPETPATLLWKMRNHRLAMHNTTDILPWFDCPECDELEVKYREAMDYYTEHPKR